jgi:RNA polymerase sigma-70 factor (ECF subfamily)
VTSRKTTQSPFWGIAYKEFRLTAVPQRAERKPLPGDFERIFEDNYDLVYRVAYRITGNAEDAEDVLQTLFLRLLRRDYVPDTERNPKAYLHRAAVNISLDLVRLRGRSVTSGDVEERIEDSRGHPEDVRRTLELEKWLREALAELNPKAAEIFILRHIEGYDNGEIARMLNTSRGTIAVLLFRARSRLKKSVRNRFGEGR